MFVSTQVRRRCDTFLRNVPLCHTTSTCSGWGACTSRISSASSSTDGVTWRAPERLLASNILPEWRTGDYPVDGHGLVFVGHHSARHNLAMGPGAATSSGGVLQLQVEHAVVLAHGKELDGCSQPPFVC